MTFGVSPAYFLSAVGEKLTPETLIPELPRIRKLGFDAVEVEVYSAADLPSWESDSRVLARALESEGLWVSQAVGHFLIDAFATAEALEGFGSVDSVLRLCEAAAALPGCSTIVLPIGAFSVITSDWSVHRYRSVWDRFVQSVSKILATVEHAGLRLSIEIQPGSLLTGSCGYLALCDALGTRRVGYNFDTGHAWAMKECLEVIPTRLAGLITGTHLCDNFGGDNLSLALGKGSISWNTVIASLLDSEYDGPLDIEVFCTRDELSEEYDRSREFLQRVANETSSSACDERSS